MVREVAGMWHVDSTMIVLIVSTTEEALVRQLDQGPYSVTVLLDMVCII